MLKLDDKNISYLVIASTQVNNMSGYLYAKDYHIVEVRCFHLGLWEEGIIAFSNSGNDETRRDAIHLLEVFHQPELNIKYFGETVAKRLSNSGTEKSLSIVNYNTDFNLPSFILGAQSFSFVEQKEFKPITKKEDLKVGMIVEYMNNERWIPKKVENPDIEFDKFYKLLVKYDKVRVAI